MRILRLAFSLALAPALLGAQVVSGTVVDGSTRQPLPGVSITVRSARDSVVLRAGVSDAQGRFRLFLPIPDTVVVTVRRMGLEPVETPPRVIEPGMERQFTFNMVPLPYLLDTVRTEISKAMLKGKLYQLTSGQEWFSRHYRDGKGLFSSGTEIKLSGLHPCDYFAALPGFDVASVIVRGVQGISCHEGTGEGPPLRVLVADRRSACIEAYVDRRFHLVAASNKQLGVMMPGYNRIRWIGLSAVQGIEVFSRYEDRPRDFSFVQSDLPTDVVLTGTGWSPATDEVDRLNIGSQRRGEALPQRCILILVWTSQLWG